MLVNHEVLLFIHSLTISQINVAIKLVMSVWMSKCRSVSIFFLIIFKLYRNL